MGTRQHQKNSPVDGYLRSPHTWFMTSLCKKLFAFLLVQESLGTTVIPKQKQLQNHRITEW